MIDFQKFPVFPDLINVFQVREDVYAMRFGKVPLEASTLEQALSEAPLTFPAPAQRPSVPGA